MKIKYNPNKYIEFIIIILKHDNFNTKTRDLLIGIHDFAVNKGHITEKQVQVVRQCLR